MKIQNQIFGFRLTTSERSAADYFLLSLILGLLTIVASSFFSAKSQPASLSSFEKINCLSCHLSVEGTVDGKNKAYDWQPVECILCNHSNGVVASRQIFGVNKRFGTNGFCVNTLNISKLHLVRTKLNKRASNVAPFPTVHRLLKSVVILC